MRGATYNCAVKSPLFVIGVLGAVGLLSSCNRLGGRKVRAVVRLEPAAAGAASLVTDEMKTLEVIGRRLTALGAGPLASTRLPGAPVRYELTFRSSLLAESLKDPLSDHRLEFRMLFDDREWPDESAARADLGPVLPADTLLLPDAGLFTGTAHTYLVSTTVEFTGCDLKAVSVVQQEPAGRAVTLTLTESAGQAMQALSRANLGRRLAILYDNQVVMAATIQNEMGAELQISSANTVEEDERLARNLNAGCTPLKPVLESVQ